jgi:predicted signal transduction protein with EAL and GGDEF domain
MVRGVIDISRALGFTCIAEGVETDNQLLVLDSSTATACRDISLPARPAGSTLPRR